MMLVVVAPLAVASRSHKTAQASSEEANECRSEEFYPFYLFLASKVVCPGTFSFLFVVAKLAIKGWLSGRSGWSFASLLQNCCKYPKKGELGKAGFRTLAFQTSNCIWFVRLEGFGTRIWKERKSRWKWPKGSSTLASCSLSGEQITFCSFHFGNGILCIS